jgi:archaetidylinositol phosphate synthase
MGIGLAGIPVISQYIAVPPVADFGIVAFAITGSLMNTFIKPVVYAEIGYREKIEGKIDDPLEGVGFFGRPETFLVLILGGVTGYIWASVIIIAVCTNLSAIQRIIYLYRTLS